MSTTTPEYAWMPYDASFLARLEATAAADTNGRKTVESEWSVAPELPDPRLTESELFIQAADARGMMTMFQGPFARQVRVRVPAGMTRTEVSFLAVHRPSGTSMSWSSLSAWPVSGPAPLVVTLFADCHEDVDSWYSITAAEGR